MADPTVFVSPPPRKQRKGGVKSVIGDFEFEPRLAAGANVEWISDGCTFPKGAPGLCYVPDPGTDPKEFEGIGIETGPIWGLYTGVHCYLGPDTDYDTRARNLLEQGEGRGVEEVLWEWASDSADPVGVAAGSLVLAIAALDERADQDYPGLPVILMARSVAVRARAEDAIFGDVEAGHLWTANGTPVIATGAASATQIIIIGWPTIYAGEINVVRVIDHKVNQEMALAERVYGLAVDCEVSWQVDIPDPEEGL